MDYVLVGAEPATLFKSRRHARERIALGLRNFADGPKNVCLQYAVEHWLLERGEGYYFTDTSKCTVSVKVAGPTRKLRYAMCASFLTRELEILQPRAIVAVGLDAYRYLRDHRTITWPPIVSVLHYSPQAVKYQRALLSGGWEKSVPSFDGLERFARSRRLPLHKDKPTNIRALHLQLVAAYRIQFEVIRRVLAGAPVTRHEAMVHVAGGSMPGLTSP